MSTPIKLTVRGIFGEFDHIVNFPPDDEFAIIYGPNGVGKTKFFEISLALSQLNVFSLAALPFDAAQTEYADGSLLILKKSASGDLEFELISGHRRDPWTCTADEMANAHSAGPEWHQIRPGIWQDQTDGETLNTREFRERFDPSPKTLSMPREFRRFLDSQSAFLIETHRLHAERADRVARNSQLLRYPRSRREQPRNAVSRYAEDITGRLREALTANSRGSAALDRTFPQRLLDSTAAREVSEEEIRTRYETQNQKRQRLARFSLIGTEPDFPLPGRDLEAWERRVLWLYLEDTESKLATFDPILERVELFEEIINKRFLRKEVHVDAESGLTITSSQQDPISPEELSSGEQHELIMFYDLLFGVPEGALVMIDEPEISLHVSWQRGFLDDMLRVSRLSRARIMVATHSPQIIGKWISRTTQLGPELHDEWDRDR